MKKTALPLILAGSLALLCSGCGGGDSAVRGEGASAGGPGALPSAAAREVNALCAQGHGLLLARAEGAKDPAQAALPVLERTIVHIARTEPGAARAKLSPFVLKFEDVVHTNGGLSGNLAGLEAKFKPSDALARRLGLPACTIG